MTGLALRRNGSSANLDFFKSNRDDLYVEVLENYLMRVNGERRVRPVPIYEVRIMRHKDGRGWWTTTFDYEPKRKPPGGHIPDRTLTRLVRQKLEETS